MCITCVSNPCNKCASGKISSSSFQTRTESDYCLLASNLSHSAISMFIVYGTEPLVFIYPVQFSH